MKSLTLLLKSIHSNNRDISIESFSDATIYFAINSGLGPYLNYCTHDSNQNSSENHSRLISSDLTAKLITNSQLHALNEIITIASPMVDEIILLKGIATCQKYYPLPHLRIMADIDLLVSNKDQPILEKILLEMGYQQESNNAPGFYQTHHHSMPFHNMKNDIWIEVHTHLFSKSSAAIDDDLFAIENIRKNCIAMNESIYPKNIKCLCPELQLIYTCTHWAEDFHIHKGAIQLIDMILLIKNNNKGLDWKKITQWTDNTASASYLYLLLSYFSKNSLLDIPDHYFKSLRLKNSNMALLNRSILFSVIDTFLPDKNNNRRFINDNILEIVWKTLLFPSSSISNFIKLSWNIVFPPDATNRYKISDLLSRITNMKNSS